MWGRNLARNLASLDALACVADNSPENAATFAAEFNSQPASLDDLCQNPSLDGVVIATPAHSHAAIAVPLMAAGKHVYIEKPLTLTMDEAARIANAARDHNRQVMVGHLIRYHAAFIELQKQLAADVIGDLRHIQATRLAMGRIRNTESVLFDLCPHDLSLILALTGSPPTRISCAGASHITPGVVDILSTVLGFDGGISAHMNTGWINPVKQHCLTVTGSKGALVFDDSRPWDEKLISRFSSTAITASGLVGKLSLKADDASIDRTPVQYICMAMSSGLKSGHPSYVTEDDKNQKS
jgi:UDP-2-acetamido-3-amino-2,3-dideoxy-glucuronate N-acetyltransferase